MNCETLQSHLSAWHDGELPVEDRDVVNAHLAACPVCRAAADELVALDARLRRVFKPDRAATQQLASSVAAKLATPALVIRRIPAWRTGLTALTAAAAGFVLAWLLLGERESPQPAPGQPPVLAKEDPQGTIQLTLATGAVEVQKDGTWSAMPTGGLLGCGQTVRTPERSRCEFRTPDGSEVRVNAGTELVFETERKVKLTKGQILPKVAPAKDKFQVLAADNTVTALGTQFDVMHLNNQTSLYVLEGKTQVERSGETQVVEAGQQLVLQDKNFPKAFHCPEEQLIQATGWVHELLILKGRDNPELSRRVIDLLIKIGHTKLETMPEEEIRSLGDHCVVPLSKYLLSEEYVKERDRRRTAARIIAELAQRESIGDMIKLLSDKDPEVRTAIAGGLKRLTGKEHVLKTQEWQSAPKSTCEVGQKKWEDWWSKNQERTPGTPKR
jgi:hypothetical protein